MHFAAPRRPVAFEHAPTVAKKLDRAIFLASFFPRKDGTDLSSLVLLLFLGLNTPNRRRSFPRRAQVDALRPSFVNLIAVNSSDSPPGFFVLTCELTSWVVPDG